MSSIQKSPPLIEIGSRNYIQKLRDSNLFNIYYLELISNVTSKLLRNIKTERDRGTDNETFL